jgi:hypothetical protein
MQFKLQEDGSYTDLDLLVAGTPNAYPAGHHAVLNWIAQGNTPDPYVAPVKTWQEKRQASIADGGYGTIPEQMEMIGEQGIGVFQAHIASVKGAIRKPV